MLPWRALRKIVVYSASAVAFSGLALWAASFLPDGLRGPAYWAVALLFAGGVLYLLDMMVPGVSLFSSVPTRLPAEAGDAVALTFDDGPVEPYTRRILDLLDRAGVKGTFFMIGENVTREPDLAREVARRGHVAGSHTFSHRVLPFLGGRDLEAEVEGGADAIARVLGARPRFFRCTKGYKSRRVLRAVRRKGMVPIGFSYPIFDVENPPPGELVARVLGRARAGDILLMHDGYAASKRGSRESLVEALPRIIEGLRGCGLRFVTLEEAFPPSGPGR